MKKKRLVTLMLAASLVVPAIGMPPVTAESEPKRVTKKWCKKHKKKCRKLYRAAKGRGGHVTVGEGWSIGTIKNPVDGTDPVLVEPSFVRSGSDPQFWKRDGGTPSKRGCRWIIGTSWVPNNETPHFIIYRVNVRKYWCWKWKRRKVYNVSTDTYVSHTYTGVGKRDDSGSQDYYQWCCGRSRSGHWTARYWEMGAWCAWIFGEACLRRYYPYVRIYVHADGTWHISGHNA